MITRDEVDRLNLQVNRLQYQVDGLVPARLAETMPGGAVTIDEIRLAVLADDFNLFDETASIHILENDECQIAVPGLQGEGLGDLAGHVLTEGMGSLEANAIAYDCNLDWYSPRGSYIRVGRQRGEEPSEWHVIWCQHYPQVIEGVVYSLSPRLIRVDRKYGETHWARLVPRYGIDYAYTRADWSSGIYSSSLVPGTAVAARFAGLVNGDPYSPIYRVIESPPSGEGSSGGAIGEGYCIDVISSVVHHDAITVGAGEPAINRDLPEFQLWWHDRAAATRHDAKWLTVLDYDDSESIDQVIWHRGGQFQFETITNYVENPDLTQILGHTNGAWDWLTYPVSIAKVSGIVTARSGSTTWGTGSAKRLRTDGTEIEDITVRNMASHPFVGSSVNPIYTPILRIGNLWFLPNTDLTSVENWGLSFNQSIGHDATMLPKWQDDDDDCPEVS